MAKDKKASARDAQVLMQLYDLRREPVMRQARKYMVSEFWPQSYDEFKALLTEFGSERKCMGASVSYVLGHGCRRDFAWRLRRESFLRLQR